MINDITGCKSTQSGQVQGATEAERVSTWFEHFSKLLGCAPKEEGVDEEIPTEDGPFSMAEYAKAKKLVKLGKSCCPDEIPPEVIKSCDLDDIILKLCNFALMKKPEQWSLLNIIPVPKYGNLYDNYRGNSLSSLIAKLYNRVLLNRIRPVLDPLLHFNQNGFRQIRTTVGQILALRQLRGLFKYECK